MVHYGNVESSETWFYKLDGKKAYEIDGFGKVNLDGNSRDLLEGMRHMAHALGTIRKMCWSERVALCILSIGHCPIRQHSIGKNP